MKQITVNLITDSEFDKLVRENWGVSDYWLSANEEWDKDTYHILTVKKGEKYEQDDITRLVEFVGSNGVSPNYMTDMLVSMLADRGLIPEGQLLIEVW